MDIKKPFVITVSREVGSGGRTIGRLLAQKLSVKYCDKELVEKLREKFALSIAQIEELKGKKKHWFSDFIQFTQSAPSVSGFVKESPNNDANIRDSVFKAENEILLGLSQEGSCIIAGRLGFHVFRDHPNKLNIFVRASYEHRLKRIMEKQKLSEEEAIETIKNIDTARENYIQRYAQVSRNDLRNYDLVINMDNLQEMQAVDVILKYIGE